VNDHLGFGKQEAVQERVIRVHPAQDESGVGRPKEPGVGIAVTGPGTGHDCPNAGIPLRIMRPAVKRIVCVLPMRKSVFLFDFSTALIDDAK